MYEEQKIEFDWKGFILKLIFLIIVIFLIIKLLPLNKMKVDNSKSEIFISNLDSMRNTGDTFFTLENLPAKTGDSIKVSLKDLVSVGAIRALRDENGELCNEDESYINATKEENKHKLELHLVCDKEEGTEFLHVKYRDVVGGVPTTSESSAVQTTTKTYINNPGTTKKYSTGSSSNSGYSNNNYNTGGYSQSTVIVTKTQKVLKTTTRSNNVLVIFNSSGGSTISAQSVTKGSIPFKPSVPTKYGYTFLGWTLNGSNYNFNTPVHSTVFLVAKWKANTGGVPAGITTTTRIYKPVTTSSVNTKPTVKYVVSFDSVGGSRISSQSINSGSYASKPNNPYKSNAVFLGWYYNNQVYNFSERVYGNITLHAKYEVTKTLTTNVYSSGWGHQVNSFTVKHNLKVPAVIAGQAFKNVRIKSLNFVRSLSSDSDIRNFDMFHSSTFDYLPNNYDYTSGRAANFATISSATIRKTSSSKYDRAVTWTGNVSKQCPVSFKFGSDNNSCLYGILYQVVWEYEESDL